MKKIILILIFSIGIINCIYSQWQHISPNLYVDAIAIKDSNIYAGTNYNGVYLSRDYGASWNAVNTGFTQSQTNVSSLTLVGSNIFAGTYNYSSDNGVFLSNNDGSTWNALYNGLPGTEWVYALTTDGTNIFAGTGGPYASGGNVFYSSNNGANWTEIDNGLADSWAVCSLIISGTNIFAGTYSNGIFLSSNNGTNWTAVNTGLSNTSVCSFAISGTDIFAGTHGGVFLSTNNGANWTEINNGIPQNAIVRSLAIIGTEIFAATENFGVFLSTNNGASWDTVNIGLTNLNVNSLVIDSSFIFAGTYGGGIWRRPLSELTGIDEINNHEINISVFPNPATENIKIIFPRKSTIEILNVGGQIIKTINNDGKETTVDLTDFSSGVYIIKAKTNEGVTIKKFIKE